MTSGGINTHQIEQAVKIVWAAIGVVSALAAASLLTVLVILTVKLVVSIYKELDNV